jgi:hypothetical protein
VSDPPIARLFEEREQVRLDDDGVAISLTVAEKPGVRVSVTVEVPVALPEILTLVGLALKPKPGRLAVVVNSNEISMKTPDAWSNAKPDLVERLPAAPKSMVDEKFRKLTGLDRPNTDSVVVALKVGADGLFQMLSGNCKLPARTK